MAGNSRPRAAGMGSPIRMSCVSFLFSLLRKDTSRASHWPQHSGAVEYGAGQCAAPKRRDGALVCILLVQPAVNVAG